MSIRRWSEEMMWKYICQMTSVNPELPLWGIWMTEPDIWRLNDPRNYIHTKRKYFIAFTFDFRGWVNFYIECLQSGAACGLWSLTDLYKAPTSAIVNCGIWAKMQIFLIILLIYKTAIFVYVSELRWELYENNVYIIYML